LVEREPSLVSPEMARLLARAWRELEQDGRFEEAERQLQLRDYDRNLIAHGLYGDQLNLKLRIFDRAEGEVQRDERRFFRTLKRRKGVLGWALKAGNVVLGSLADAIPGGAAIKEFKDAAEAALDERVPLRQRLRAGFRRVSRRPREVDEPEPPVSA